MKKVLSVLLAAAMVMGMSVASFAANTANGYVTYTNTDSSVCYHGTTDTTRADITKIKLADAWIVRDGNWIGELKNDAALIVGDDLYFKVMTTDGQEVYGADKHWSINIKNNKYVEKASFVMVDTNSNNSKELWVKVEIVDALDDLDSKDVEFKMYIADKKSASTNNQSAGVAVDLTFDNYVENYVEFDWTNDVDYTARWVVREEEKGTATFDFEDEAYFTVKMIPEEEVIFNFSQAYDKAIDKAYNEYDADLTFYNFKGTKDAFTKVGELFIPADDETFIYEIVDGELVEIDAEYVEDYEVDSIEKDGWVISTKELGYYVVADDELVVAEVETEVEAPVEAEKANPETGAADFVGAAVAMAVVSVAAAGALALKK